MLYYHIRQQYKKVEGSPFSQKKTLPIFIVRLIIHSIVIYMCSTQLILQKNSIFKLNYMICSPKDIVLLYFVFHIISTLQKY